MGLIPDDIVARVLERSDIVEIAATYIPLKRAGRNFKAPCPFHNEKTPSFVISPDKQIFHCFGCGAGGNVFAFVMRQERMEFPEAVRFLAAKANIEIPETTTAASNAATQFKQSIYKVNSEAVEFYHRQLLTDKSAAAQAARDYLKKRGILLETVKKFQLGLSVESWDGLLQYLKGKDFPLKTIEQAGLIVASEKTKGFHDRFRSRIMFPIFDNRSQCVGFGGRTLKADVGAKYINSPETPVYTKGAHLFGLNHTKAAIGQMDAAVVVEGYMDMVIPYQYGVKNIVASLGTALTSEQIRLLRRFTRNVIMLYDADPAGQAAIVRSLDLFVDEDVNVRVAIMSAGDDPDTFIRKNGLEEFQKRLDEALSLFDFKFQWLAAQTNSKSVEGKAKICEEMLTTINRFKNEVVRFGLLQQLANRLALPQEVVTEQAKQSIKNQPSRISQYFEKPPEANSYQKLSAEHFLLHFFLENGDWIVKAKNKISVQDFLNPKIRDIIEAIWEETSSPQNAAMLLNKFIDPESQALLVGTIDLESQSLKDKQKLFDDCLKRLVDVRAKRQRQNLTALIHEAEQRGDHKSLEELKAELTQLIKQKV